MHCPSPMSRHVCAHHALSSRGFALPGDPPQYGRDRSFLVDETRLDVRLDLDARTVDGDAMLRVRRVDPKTREVELDAIAFENVRFRYTDDRWVLDGVTLAAEPGQLVALVGASGAGKTTIANLVPRFYDPQEGRFTSEDPIGYASDPNLFRYVRNDPVNNTDPSGRDIVQQLVIPENNDAPQQAQAPARPTTPQFLNQLSPEEFRRRTGPPWGRRTWSPGWFQVASVRSRRGSMSRLPVP